MKRKVRNYEVTADFLRAYREAALDNAAELLEEAHLLLRNGHFARAYFLAIASMEETGKAHLAFVAEGRNLSDQGLREHLKQDFDDHSPKISSAFVSWMAASADKREAVRVSVDLMIHLKRGRETSMYVDGIDGNKVSRPSIAVKGRNAQDAIRIAENCLHHTKVHLSTAQPPKFSAFDDKFFCLNTGRFQKIFNEPDFGEYLLHRVTKDGSAFDFAKTIVTYHDVYFSKKVRFAEPRS